MLSAMGFLSRLFGRESAAPKEYRPAQIVHEAFDGAVRVFEVPKGKSGATTRTRARPMATR